ncbi:MAG: 50S ribosomal protein L23 [Tissierellia bacterium]|nr:50S ribosomal protein L23 [Tissierellia bacterium]
MNIYDIILRPIITEASMEAMEENKYTFQVARGAGKAEIKKAVETIFGVTVESVNTINMKGKTKRLGMRKVRRPHWKKAIVKLTDDSKTIEFFDSMQ